VINIVLYRYCTKRGAQTKGILKRSQVSVGSWHRHKTRIADTRGTRVLLHTIVAGNKEQAHSDWSYPPPRKERENPSSSHFCHNFFWGGASSVHCKSRQSLQETRKSSRSSSSSSSSKRYRRDSGTGGGLRNNMCHREQRRRNLQQRGWWPVVVVMMVVALPDLGAWRYAGVADAARPHRPSLRSLARRQQQQQRNLGGTAANSCPSSTNKTFSLFTWNLKELVPHTPPPLCQNVILRHVNATNIPDILKPCALWKLMYGGTTSSPTRSPRPSTPGK
jgi:hypothetical protein